MYQVDSSDRINKLHISKSRIVKNWQLLQSVNPQISISPVLKSNAFGHGADLIGPLLDSSLTPFFCTSSYFEAQVLRNAGVKADILIMGYVEYKDIQKESSGLIFTIADVDQAKMLNASNKRIRVHINVETGLHREGIELSQFESILDAMKNFSYLKIEGIYSHLSCSNDPRCENTSQQLRNFKKAKEIAKTKGIIPRWFHLGGSLALLNNLADECNVVRCGKAFFGITLNSAYLPGQTQVVVTNPLISQFKPTLTLTSKLAHVKHIRKGDRVSYADAFIADKDMTIGILPVGYYDGVDRRLSNKGVMKVGDTFCQIIGLVAMNVCVIDISAVSNPQPGMEVVVYSSDSLDQNSLDNSAKLCGTISQDILVSLPETLPRILIE